MDIGSGEHFESERKTIQDIKDQLERERREFTEAAIKMGRERSILQKEKHAFEEQKRIWETESLLMALPATPR